MMEEQELEDEKAVTVPNCPPPAVVSTTE